MNHEVQTSVIGSYPVSLNTSAMMDSYHKGVLPSWRPYIDSAVSSMMDAGVDMISDGQTTDPFIHIFVRGLNGCRIRKRPEVIGPIVLAEPITGNDLQYVSKKLGPDRQLLGLIVGPFTLSQSVVDQYYHDSKECAFGFAQALKKEIQSIESMVDMISIDEPFFANTLPDFASDLIRMLTKDVPVPTRLHVCGDVSSIVSDLVDFPVDLLSHEFKATPHLFDVFAQYPNSKKICLGAVRSDQTRVESVEEIIDHITRANNVFEDRLVQIAPDCGLRMLPESIAYKKLENLVSAKRKIYG